MTRGKKPEAAIAEAKEFAERMVVQDSYLFLTKNTDPTRFSGAHFISIRSPVSI